MEPLECLKDYFGRFHPFSFNEFSEIYNLLYSDYENLQNRIEFSLLIDKDNEIDLRFGLFKLYDTQRISSLFRKKWYEIPDLERILNLAKGFTPEFALGFDFKGNHPRIKVYLLRLPDNPQFIENPVKRIRSLSTAIGVDLANLDEKEIEGCYLLGLDFHKGKTQNLKIYTKEMNVAFSRINDCLRKNGVASQHLGYFRKMFSEGESRDVTFSRKYPVDSSAASGFSIFFDANGNSKGRVSNSEVSQLVRTCVPERYGNFDETLKALEAAGEIVYSHIGLTFNGCEAKESICLYFSPRFWEARK